MKKISFLLILSSILLINCAGGLTTMLVSNEKLRELVLNQSMTAIKNNEINSFYFELPYSGWYSLGLAVGNDVCPQTRDIEEKIDSPFSFRVILYDNEENDVIYMDSQYEYPPNAIGYESIQISTSKLLSHGRPFVPKKKMIAGKLIISKLEDKCNPINLRIYVDRSFISW